VSGDSLPALVARDGRRPATGYGWLKSVSFGQLIADHLGYGFTVITNGWVRLSPSLAA
jgi:hypothetical protein